MNYSFVLTSIDVLFSVNFYLQRGDVSWEMQKCPYYAIFKVANIIYECPKTGLHASKVKKHFSFLKKCNLSKWFLNESSEAVRRIRLNPSFHCCD